MIAIENQLTFITRSAVYKCLKDLVVGFHRRQLRDTKGKVFPSTLFCRLCLARLSPWCGSLGFCFYCVSLAFDDDFLVAVCRSKQTQNPCLFYSVYLSIFLDSCWYLRRKNWALCVCVPYRNNKRVQSATMSSSPIQSDPSVADCNLAPAARSIPTHTHRALINYN